MCAGGVLVAMPGRDRMTIDSCVFPATGGFESWRGDVVLFTVALLTSLGPFFPPTESKGSHGILEKQA